MFLLLLVFSQYYVEAGCQLSLLLYFMFPLRTELSGFDDWPPIQQCVSESDNE